MWKWTVSVTSETFHTSIHKSLQGTTNQTLCAANTTSRVLRHDGRIPLFTESVNNEDSQLLKKNSQLKCFSSAGVCYDPNNPAASLSLVNITHFRDCEWGFTTERLLDSTGKQPHANPLNSFRFPKDSSGGVPSKKGQFVFTKRKQKKRERLRARGEVRNSSVTSGRPTRVPWASLDMPAVTELCTDAQKISAVNIHKYEYIFYVLFMYCWWQMN